MNNLIDAHQENNDIVAPESLEGRANQMYEYLMSNYQDLGPQNLASYSQNFAQRFPLTKEEGWVLLPYLFGKISKSIMNDFDQSKVGDSLDKSNPRQFLFIALHFSVLMAAYEYDRCDIDEGALDKEIFEIVCFCVPSILLHTHYSGDLIVDHSVFNSEFMRRSHGFIGEFFGLTLELYPVWSPQRKPSYWIEILKKSYGSESKFLQSVPFVWSEKEFKGYMQSSPSKSLVRIDGKLIKVDQKNKERYEQGKKEQTKRSHIILIDEQKMVKEQDILWYARLVWKDSGSLMIEYIPGGKDRLDAYSYKHNPQASTFETNGPLKVRKIDSKVLNKGMSLIFPNLNHLRKPSFDEQLFAVAIKKLREYDAQKSLSDKAQPIVENVSQDVTTLTHRTFINPKQHHTDVAQSLGLDIVDHSDDIGAAEAIGSNYLRYKNQNGESSLHYLPKIAWLIDILEDIIPKNEHGKITAYTLPSSPYIFVYTNTGTIFISDIDNVSTQVFAQKVDPSFVNSDFSFPKLGELFGPLTSIKNNFEEVISDESAESWAQHILSALNKKDGYFLDLIDDEHHDWGVNLHTLYQYGEITKKDFATPMDLEQFLKGYNQKLLHNSSIPNKQKKSLSFANSRGKVPSTQVLINILGGNKFFTWYHGHTSVFCEYFDTLLSNNGEQRDSIFEQLRSNHTARISIKSWIDELKDQTRTLSETQFYGLFSTDTYIKKMMRKELELPSGLFTSTGWIIALGYDPEKLVGGETSEMYLYRILVEEKILRRGQ